MLFQGSIFIKGWFLWCDMLKLQVSLGYSKIWHEHYNLIIDSPWLFIISQMSHYLNWKIKKVWECFHMYQYWTCASIILCLHSSIQWVHHFSCLVTLHKKSKVIFCGFFLTISNTDPGHDYGILKWRITMSERRDKKLHRNTSSLCHSVYIPYLYGPMKSVWNHNRDFEKRLYLLWKLTKNSKWVKLS